MDREALEAPVARTASVMRSSSAISSASNRPATAAAMSSWPVGPLASALMAQNTFQAALGTAARNFSSAQPRFSERPSAVPDCLVERKRGGDGMLKVS
ncbi:hypothetical protein [Methylobacterium sp. 391_Methyba4]|uniref:hypothetical protein n=1 Tax=Methylobacterium sp. 391_Methyba4 TaxID=3038924 RepID=UPI00241D283F|nr:hypothetical protein [Methylobacterium sp. 391_Methyba4]WFS09078.1 hypothetical protein P9K36_07220 [Methylobacterium sp. 391_Methyba4]